MRLAELINILGTEVMVDAILESTGEVLASKATEDHYEMFEEFGDREIALVDMWHNTLCIYIKEMM